MGGGEGGEQKQEVAASLAVPEELSVDAKVRTQKKKVGNQKLFNSRLQIFTYNFLLYSSKWTFFFLIFILNHFEDSRAFKPSPSPKKKKPVQPVISLPVSVLG